MISENGWAVYDTTDHFTRFTAAGRGWWAANPDCAVVAAEFISRWDAEVESVTRDDQEYDDWSYAFRAVRGQTTGYSNHASATAWDINATQHPRGVALSKTFTAAQVADVHRIRSSIVDDVGLPVFRWGGDYVISPVDGMHIEIRTSAAKVKQAANILRERNAEMALTAKDIADAVWKDDVIPDEQDPSNATWRASSSLARVKARTDRIEAKLDDEIKLNAARHAELLAHLAALQPPV